MVNTEKIDKTNNTIRCLVDYYRHENDILFNSYNLMGMLLDEQLVERRIKELMLEQCYVYGGGFLGIQCFKAIEKFSDVKGIVDKKGILKFDIPRCVCLDFEKFKRKYQGEKIIVTPVQYITEIHRELMEFVSNDNQIFLGEFIQSCM